MQLLSGKEIRWNFEEEYWSLQWNHGERIPCGITSETINTAEITLFEWFSSWITHANTWFEGNQSLLKTSFSCLESRPILLKVIVCDVSMLCNQFITEKQNSEDFRLSMINHQSSTFSIDQKDRDQLTLCSKIVGHIMNHLFLRKVSPKICSGLHPSLLI